jgi:hypothetical protein
MVETETMVTPKGVGIMAMGQIVEMALIPLARVLTEVVTMDMDTTILVMGPNLPVHLGQRLVVLPLLIISAVFYQQIIT